MNKYTPGPWTASEGSPSDVWHVDMPDRQFSITVARGDEDWDMSVEEVQANARLIAAAPDLLAAAVQARNVIHDDCPATRRAVIMLKNAITQAGGAK